MKFSAMNKIKIFLISVIVILLLGALVFGIFGANTAPDYKDGYELNVSVDANIGKASDVLKSATESYLESKGVQYSKYDVSTLDDGGILIIRFSENISDKISLTDLEVAVEEDMQGTEILKSIEVTAKLVERNDYSSNSALWITVGLAVALVLAFVYVTIVHKIQASVAVFAVSILASMVFASILTITRISVRNFFLPSIIATGALSAIFALSIVAKCTNTLKVSSNDKISYSVIAEKSVKSSILGMIFATGLLVVFALVIVILGSSFFKFLGLQIAISAICSFVTAYILTAFLWEKLKPYSKKRSDNVGPSKEEK